MVRFIIGLNISIQAVIFLSCLCQESASLNLKGNHRIHPPYSIGKNINRNLPISPLNPIREPQLQAFSLAVENDTEGQQLQQQQSAQRHTSHPLTINTTVWNSVLAPSTVAVATDHTELTTVEKLRIATVVGCAANAFLALVLKTSPGSWRFFLAGGLCAAISHTIPTPVDVVKTRKQVDPRLVDHSFLEAARYIAKDEGFSALWAGLGPTTFGYLLEGAIKFGVYEVLKPALKCWLSRIASISSSLTLLNSQFVTFVLSGIFSGLAASFVLCPMEVIRIRLVAEPNYTSGGWIRGGLKILKNEGVHGFTKGLNPMILKQVPYTVTKNVSFDLITRFFYSSLLQSGVATISHGMKFTIPLVSAAIASVLSSLTSQPGDTILSLSCAHDGDYKTRDISRNILRSDRGITGFFVGTKTRLLHVGIIVTIQLLIYDYVKRLCGIAATGL